jgi:hypothetical protein
MSRGSCHKLAIARTLTEKLMDWATATAPVPSVQMISHRSVYPGGAGKRNPARSMSGITLLPK